MVCFTMPCVAWWPAVRQVRQGEHDQQPSPERANNPEQELAEADVSPAATTPIRIAPIQPRARCDGQPPVVRPAKKGNREDGERERSQQKKPMAAMERMMPRKIMAVSPKERF